MRALLHRLAHAGIAPSMSARDAKHVIVRNVVILLSAAQSTAVALTTAILGFHLVPWVLLAGAIVTLTVVPITARLSARAGLVVILVVICPAIGVPSVLAGAALHGDLYYLTAMAGAWLIFPSTRHALIATVCAFVSQVAVLILYRQLAPIDPPPAATAGWVGLVALAGATTSIGALAFWSHRQTDLSDRHLADERARADRLLRNMLPEPIAERLKRAPGVIADGFERVSVLFADLAGFTPLSARLSPHELVRILDDVFSTFDELAHRHGLEKIKTIGDAYMVVGGVPEPCADHAERVAAMALDMRAAMARFADRGLQLRIGINSGPVVAGVIGKAKYSYDLWGDTVNTAARMESHGVPGEIHVTEATYLALRDRYALDDRGLVDVKGKGPMRTYFLRGLR